MLVEKIEVRVGDEWIQMQDDCLQEDAEDLCCMACHCRANVSGL
jgi:hypothetical protein